LIVPFWVVESGQLPGWLKVLYSTGINISLLIAPKRVMPLTAWAAAQGAGTLAKHTNCRGAVLAERYCPRRAAKLFANEYAVRPASAPPDGGFMELSKHRGSSAQHQSAIEKKKAGRSPPFTLEVERFD
jgi:hypothetical protein